MEKAQFLEKVNTLEKKVESTKDNDKELKERIINTLKNMDKKKVFTMEVDIEDLTKGGERKIVNEALTILDKIQNVIKDGIIDQKDKQIVDKITSLFDKLEDYVDKTVDEDKGITEAIAGGIVKKFDNAFPKLEGKITDQDLKEIFGDNIPHEPMEIIQKIADYIRGNFVYDSIGFLLTPKSNIGGKIEEKIIKEMLDVYSLLVSKTNLNLGDDVNKLLDKYRHYFDYVKTNIEKTFSPEDIKKSKELLFLHSLFSLKNIDVTSADLNTIVKKIQKQFPEKSKKLLYNLNKYDHTQINDLRNNLKTGVCRNFAMFTKKVFNAIEKKYPSIDIKADISYVADIKMQHAYNVLYIKKGNKVEKKVIDTTWYLGGGKLIQKHKYKEGITFIYS